MTLPELLTLCWDKPEHQDAAYQYIAERGAGKYYDRLKVHVRKAGAHAALMAILPQTEFVSEFRLWCCLAARAEREIQAEAASN